MYEMADYEFIRKQYFRLGKSIRQISKETGISRQTIRKALNSKEEKPKYHLSTLKPKPVMETYLPVIEQWLLEDQNAPRKQRHTAKRIYDRLHEEYRFTGGESTVRHYVRQLKMNLEQNQPTGYVPLEFPPGQFAQFDWGEVEVILSGKKVVVQVFCMRLCFSRKIFVKVFINQKQEALLQGHVDAFTYFGYVPKTISYDNLKTAVKKILQGKNREEQDRFIQLRSHYLFDSHFNEPAKGNQKGQVEHLVKYAQQNFFTPLPSAGSLDEINDILREKCDRYDQHLVPQTSLTVAEAFEMEKPELLPLPAYPLPCCKEVYVSSNSLSQVAFETNRYSVPIQYERKKDLLLKAFVDKVEIYDGQTLIASHLRSYEKGKEFFHFDHYLDLLAIRPGAVPYARPLIHAKLPAIFREFEGKLVSTSQGCREYIQILKLLRTYEKKAVEAALQEAAAQGMYVYDVVQQILYRMVEIEPPLVPLSNQQMAHLPAVKVQRPNVSQYNTLIHAARKEMIH